MSRADELLGKDGVGRVRLVVKGDVYAQFGDDGTQGDGGSATYDSDGNWVTTSASTGCPGCTGTWKWSYDDGRLRLKLLEGTEVGDPVELLVTRLVVEGTYARR